ncbi:FAD-dependent monooxygenase [Streptomyces sp. NPDC001922]|uniref:FAD-dependent monooxygenase n=1 Tax=Streptomyces sp. NPDC001922 TaxID=3364624 RepID=UPI0036D14AFA
MTVLIAGAGPTGLTLAIDLARRGVPCRVVDKAPGLFPGSRGKGLSQRTQEVFDDLGVINAVLTDGMPFPKFRRYSGHEVVFERHVNELLGAEPLRRGAGVPYPDLWLLPQWRTDEILYERFVQLGGRVEFGTEVLGFDQDADGVTVQTTAGQVRATYLVGCDGGRSTVRKALGVGFVGETFESERTLIGDVQAEGLDGVFCHMFSTGTGRFSLWNMPGGQYYQFVAGVAAENVPELTLDSVRHLLHERSGRTDIRLHDLKWISLYRVNARMADRYRAGRVLLAGDAAHVHSSAGGQGLNTSIQDSYNLGWKLAAVLGGAPKALLDSYETERMPVAAHVLGMSSTLHRLDFRPQEGWTPAIHQLDVSYRHGPLAVDDRPALGQLRAGDRAPDGTLDDGTRLFDVFRGPHFTLLAFGDLPNRRCGDGVRVRQGTPSDAYDVEDGTLILVRPDGYIGVMSQRIDTVLTYLEQLTCSLA